MIESCTKRVLVVEDDADIREILVSLLEGEGLIAEAAKDGREAVERLARGPAPCLIFLDLMMPVMNGLEFLEWFKGQDPSLSRIPVVVLTANRSLAAQVPSGTSVAIVDKPISLDRLFEIVERYCDEDAR